MAARKRALNNKARYARQDRVSYSGGLQSYRSHFHYHRTNSCVENLNKRKEIDNSSGDRQYTLRKEVGFSAMQDRFLSNQVGERYPFAAELVIIG